MTRFEAVFLSLLLVSLWTLMPATQLWDWDEPMYARTGIEMWQSGDLILPRFNGELFGHKPPFGFWVMGLAARLMGETEFAVRFFSAPALALAAYLTGRTGAILFNRTIGDFAMVIFATGFLALYLGASAMLDAYLVVGCGLSVWAMAHMVRDRKVDLVPWVWFTLGGLMTLLVKGPVGPALIGGLALGLWVFLPRDQRPGWGGFALLVLGGLIGIGGFLAWFLPANTQAGGDLAGQVVGVHIIGRALAPMEGHGGRGLVGFLLFLPVYIPVLLVAVLPWTVYLPAALRHLFQGIDRKNRVFLLAWALPLFVIFSIAATKLPHYIFPIVAPLSIAMASLIAGVKDANLTLGKVITSVIYIAFAAVLVVASVQITGTFAAPVVLASLGFVLMAALTWRADVSVRSVIVLAIGSIGVMHLLFWGGLRALETQTKLSKDLGAAIQTHVPRDAPLYMGSYREPSLAFYAARPVSAPIQPVDPGTMAETLQTVPHGFAVFTDQDIHAFQTVFPDRQILRIDQAAARNFNRNGELQTVVLLEWFEKTK